MKYTVDIYLNRNPMAFARGYLASDPVEMVARLPVRGQTPFAAADEVFDLTNNPHRNREAGLRGLGTSRSLSVGDVVVIRWVDSERWLHQLSLGCAPFGWQPLGAPWPSDPIGTDRLPHGAQPVKAP